MRNPMTTTVSIIVCTHNRAMLLPALLESLGNLEIPPNFDCEAVIVNSASTDGTASYLERADLPNMPLRVFTADRPGKSVALNVAIRSTDTDILLFSDDDIEQPKNWIGRITAPILIDGKDAAAGGALLAPELDKPGTDLMTYLFLGDTRLETNAPPDLRGGNMAGARRVFDRVPGYDENLGGRRLGCEDTLFSMQVRAHGFTIGNARDVIACHRPDMRRLHPSIFRAHSYRHGRSEAYIAYHWERRFVSDIGGKLKQVIAALRSWRLANPAERERQEGLAKEEVMMLIRVGFLRQYALERKRPRLYPYRSSAAALEPARHPFGMAGF
jgi:glucosyl-dolichyl phosphate glucuronosyltransferase